MDKVHKLDASRLSMFKSMLQSICASKGRGSLGPKSRSVLPLFNEIFIEHPSPFCVKNCNIVKCLFKCVISKRCQLLRSTHHHGSINEWVWSVGGKLLTGEKPSFSEESLSKCHLVYCKTCTKLTVCLNVLFQNTLSCQDLHCIMVQ